MSAFIEALDAMKLTTKDRDRLRELHYADRAEYGTAEYRRGKQTGQREAEYNRDTVIREIKGEVMQRVATTLLGQPFMDSLLAYVESNCDCSDC